MAGQITERNWNKEVSDKMNRCLQDVILNFIIDGVPSSSSSGLESMQTWERVSNDFDEEFKLNEIDLDEYDKEFPLQVMRLKYK